MRAARRSLAAKAAAWVLLLAACFSACLCAAWAVLGLPYVRVSSWTDSSQFDFLLERRGLLLSEYLSLLVDLTDEQLSYLERQELEERTQSFQFLLQAENTCFRFRVCSQDGQTEIFTNLSPGETLRDTAEQVHYQSLTLSSPLLKVQTREDGGYTAEWGEPGEACGLVLEYGVDSSLAESLGDEFAQLYQCIQWFQNVFRWLIAGAVASAVLALACFCWILWSAGYRAGKDAVVLSWQDRIFFDLYAPIALVLAGALGMEGIYFVSRLIQDAFVVQGWTEPPYYLPLLGAIAVGAAAVLTLLCRTFAVRLRARALARTTLLCRVVRWIARVSLNFILGLPLSWRAAVGFLAYLAGNFLLIQYSYHSYSTVAGILCLGLNLAVLMLFCWWSACFRRIREGGAAIASGNFNHQIDTGRMPSDLRRHAEDLNNISSGMTHAVNEQMKSERFKAELITNVSHDLKTPLTSIINYVNLLKTTRQEDPKAAEYIDVLDRKSQRLKKLTEDLVEASKASTGALTVNREKLGLGQLVSQALGEYEEKLEASRLTLVTALPEEEVYVYADGRHLWRVLDNLLGNCVKYALEGTRVYLEVVRGGGKVTLSLKNVSREALNVPPERLMERFVRGEESRTTEGSGLGLSIARSLTELQGGTFQLTVDGDLFKAIVTIPQAG